jgi:hypothetical protein
MPTTVGLTIIIIIIIIIIMIGTDVEFKKKREKRRKEFSIPFTCSYVPLRFLRQRTDS